MHKQVHGSLLLKTPSFEIFTWIYKIRRTRIFSGKIQNLAGLELSEETTLALHWRKISYFCDGVVLEISLDQIPVTTGGFELRISCIRSSYLIH